MGLSDKQLLKKARQGDEESLRLIYLGHKDRLFTIAEALLHDWDMAEDFVQDVFVAFAGDLKDLRLCDNLGGYLSVSVCNRARDIIRTRVRRQGKLEAAIEPKEGADSPETVASQQRLSNSFERPCNPCRLKNAKFCCCVPKRD